MGIQDRDYYREWWNKRNGSEEKAVAQGATVHKEPPELWGANWHWSLKLLVWLAIVVLMLAAWRLVRP